ncbi:MAG: S-layer homology domain-containing protein [Nitriliruptorales bacterium]
MSALTRISHGRVGALVAAVVLVLTLAPASPGIADHGVSRGTDDVCPPPGEEETEERQFSDTEGSTHADNIDCVAQYGIAAGFQDGTYRPSQDINRAQMATFIRNFVEVALSQPLEDPPIRQFTDTEGSVHADNIDAVANAGIVSGHLDRTYRPANPVSRGQMATFIANAIDYADDRDVNSSEPPPTQESFFDDTEGSTHEGNIDRLAAQHIVVGDGQGNFSPSRNVSRAAMATFVMQGGDYLEEIQRWLVSPAELTIAPQEAEQAANLNHRLTATVFDDLGQRFTGAIVRFEAYRQRGSTEQGTLAFELVADGDDSSFPDGEASFSYNADAAEGEEDTIIACVLEEGDEPGAGEEFCGERQVGQDNVLIGIAPREDRITAQASLTWTAETEPEAAEDGGYLGEVIALDADGDLLDVQTFDEDFLRFAYDDTDTFHVNDNEDVTVGQFECATQATIDADADHTIGIDYESEGDSEYRLVTDADVDACFEE